MKRNGKTEKGNSNLSKSRFDVLNSITRRFYLFIIIIWIVIIIGSIAFIPNFFNATTYNLTDSAVSSPDDSESKKAQAIINSQFSSPITEGGTSGGDSIILVIRNNEIYSNDIRKSIFSLEDTINSDESIKNFKGMSSIYSLESDLVRSFTPSLISQTQNFSSNIKLMNKGLYDLKNNLTAMHMGLFGLKNGINETAQIVYGIPLLYTSTWLSIYSQGEFDIETINQQANQTVLETTSYFEGNTLSNGYYSIFLNSWIQSFSNSSITDPLERTQFAVSQSIPIFLENDAIDITLNQLMSSVSYGLNVTTWNDENSITILALNMFASQIPDIITSYVGVSPAQLTQELYALSPTPNSEAIPDLTLTLFAKSLASQNSSFTSLISNGSTEFDLPLFIRSVYDLGNTPSDTSIWTMTSGLIARATSQSLSLSPLFTVNEHELFSLLQNLNNVDDIDFTISEIIKNNNIDDYPLILSPSLSEKFVNQNNNTMLSILSFNTGLNSSEIYTIKNILKSSDLYASADVYATGNSIFAEDMAVIFDEVEGLTILAGVIISLIIAGILFRSPIAAIFPLLIAGVSILISYPAIYFGVVVIGQGSISFMTPLLATLLMLGLGVDYSVILLRRTREERQAGKSNLDSVGISTKWGGQAVLTAGLAVIASYIVMAIANVPMFSDVGIAIAIGVGVLLAVSITLVPSLEILLGDKLFWPLKIRNENVPQTKPSILSKIADVTLRNKFPIIFGIVLLGAGSFYIAQTTPTGMDFSKLLPDFPSNQGITEIVENMGSSNISPMLIPITMSTPIVDKSNQFDFTLFDVIEQITNTVEKSDGVSSVTSTTRPFGAVFDYRTVNNLPEPVRSQYMSGILDTIGKDNKTVLITVGLSDTPFDSKAISSILEVQSNINDLSLPTNIDIHYGGLTQSIYESDSLLDIIFPQIIIILVAVIYVLLFLQLWSAFTPLRLIFTILTSVVVSLASIYFIFYYTLNIPIVSFVPLFVAVTMLGVGIDYDIFLVTRIREEVLKGKSDNEAIKIAITKTGGTIIGLGLILASVFGSLIFTGIPIMAEIGMAVSAAVLFDSIIVILFVVPALMGLAQKLNWWPTKPKRKTEN
ncbi:MAG TPA: MMPL family transporter [Nitrososphaerales archaeon]